MSTATKFCPRCGTEYAPTTLMCADCAIELADEPPPERAEGAGLAGEQLAYDLSDWNAPQRIAADEMFSARGVPHTWEDDDLIVPAAYEAVADELLDQLEHPDQLDAQEGTRDEARAAEVLSELFLVSDRLQNNPEHHAPIGEFVVLAEAAAELRAPWGLDGGVWEQAQMHAAVVRADLVARADRNRIAKGARRVRELLRPYV